MGGRNSRKRPGYEVLDPPWYYNDWRMVENCTFKKWRKRRCVLCGFSPVANYAESALRFRPSAIGGRHMSASVISPESLAIRLGLDSDDVDPLTLQNTNLPPYLQGGVMDMKRVLVVEDFKERHPRLVENVEALKLGGLLRESCDEDASGLLQRPLKGVNVIGGRDDRIVLQVIRASGANKIVVLRELANTYRVDELFTVETEDDEPYLMEATLSPDFTRLLLQPCWGFARTYRFEPEKNDLCLYDLTDRSRRVPDPQVIYPMHGDCVVAAFDPRYGRTRLVTGCRQMQYVNDMLQLLDLSSSEQSVVLATSPADRVQTTQNLVYSPDGRYIVSLVASVRRKCMFQILTVLVYDSEKLTVLAEFKCFPEMWEVGPMPYTMFPVFSMNGQYLAVYMVAEVDAANSVNEDVAIPPLVRVMGVPVEICLQNLCRLVLRRWLVNGSVNQLPLPTRLKDYLLFRPSML